MLKIRLTLIIQGNEYFGKMHWQKKLKGEIHFNTANKNALIRFLTQMTEVGVSGRSRGVFGITMFQVGEFV